MADETLDWPKIAEGIRNSDEQAMERAFRVLYPAIYRYVSYKNADTETAEDIAQETFLRLWQSRENLDPRRFTPSWLYSTANRLYLNHVRHVRVVEESAREVALLYEPGDVDTAVEDRLWRCIEKLPPQPKSTFLMSRVENLKYREIADRLELSVKTVEAHIGRALKWLRECLGD